MTTAVEVDQFKITVSVSEKRWKADGGHDEVYAAVQQSIPDEATDEQIQAFVAKLAEPLKAAVSAALPEQEAPKPRSTSTSTPRTQSRGPVKIVGWSPRDNRYNPVEDSAVAGLFEAEGDTSWVIPAAIEQFPGVREVLFAQTKDKSGTYFQARGSEGKLGYVQRPESGQEQPDEEPF